MISFIQTQHSLILSHDGETKSIRLDSPFYPLIKSQIIKREDPKKIMQSCSMYDLVKLRCHSSGLFSIDQDSNIWVNGEQVHKVLADKIYDFVEQGLPFEPLVNFWKNCQENPDPRAKTDLYGFLAHNGIPITEDGCFVAYRGVTSDFKDPRTGTFDNSVGKMVRMPRSECNPNPEDTCSTGLHAAALDYVLAHYHSGKVVLVKINPKNLVSVPTDYDKQKLRCCEFEVISEYAGKLPIVDSLVTDRATKVYTDNQNSLIFGNLEVAQGGYPREMIITFSGGANSGKSVFTGNMIGGVDWAKSPDRSPKTNAGWANKRDANGRFIGKNK
jgi:hypothetical protein